MSASDSAPSADRTPQLAVVTVTYSPGEHLDHFISTLATATAEKPQVILADNGSTDGAPELAAESNEHVTLLRTGGNIGYGGAVNRAVAELDPDIEYVIIANPDVRWGTDSIDQLLAAARRWPRAGALGPLIHEPDGSIY
ncbi:glycosyltransferase family 2 protein, partial [Nocardia nova]|uniref:glycosyltransferase family 2 protein n=2 Tax=Nocardia TaxID=1817 RepID=UPI0025C8A46B|nr:glycosyltransferase family 2 protein [Nocardia nova]